MKIKYSLLRQWCKSKLTNKELTFLLFIARYQDQDGSGQVKGIYYKDIMEKCNMCQRTFYLVLPSLKQKGLIDYKRKKNDYDITILNNDFTYEGSLKEGYINVNKKIFDSEKGNKLSEKFNKLRVNEKLLLLLLMRNTHVNKGQYKIGRKTFYDEYTEILGVTEKVLRSYLHSLKSIFYVWSMAGNLYVKFSGSSFKDKEEKEVDQYLDHIVRVGCRRNCVEVNSTTVINDTRQLIKQYRQEAKEVGQDIFDILNSCLAECKKSILNSKYIHKLMRRALQIEHRPIIRVEF